jgi:hypothetical protein
MIAASGGDEGTKAAFSSPARFRMMACRQAGFGSLPSWSTILPPGQRSARPAWVRRSEPVARLSRECARRGLNRSACDGANTCRSRHGHEDLPCELPAECSDLQYVGMEQGGHERLTYSGVMNSSLTVVPGPIWASRLPNVSARLKLASDRRRLVCVDRSARRVSKNATAACLGLLGGCQRARRLGSVVTLVLCADREPQGRD